MGEGRRCINMTHGALDTYIHTTLDLIGQHKTIGNRIHSQAKERHCSYTDADERECRKRKLGRDMERLWECD